MNVIKSQAKTRMDSGGTGNEYPVWKKVIAGISILFGSLILLMVASVITLRWVNPSTTSFVLQENWQELEAERYSLREWWVPVDELPDHLKWAVIASEDQRFIEHRGFDFEAIQEALEEQRQNGRSRGASTISQQVAKNLYLWPAHSYFRKGLEACITVLIELVWSKDRILEVYLNVVEFGPGLYGVGKASSEFFGLEPLHLEPGMSARLAAVLPSPKRMRVEPPSPFALERSEWILRQMVQLTGVDYRSPTEDGDSDPFPMDMNDESGRDPETVPDGELEGFPEEGQEVDFTNGDQETIHWDEIPDSLLYFD